MPTIDQLLLSMGGGITVDSMRSPRDENATYLCIGIGGTGLKALATLKQKVYRQIEPDEPDAPVPEYKHIRFLAIDSDETQKQNLGNISFVGDEWFSIYYSELNSVLNTDTTMHQQVISDRKYNWFQAGEIGELDSLDGAGGKRQVGRFLLIRRSGQLKACIDNLITEVITGAATNKVHVYVLAGISGGTGSGCFLDTCYIVRKVLRDKGLMGGGASITGVFFLPDVVIDQKDLRNDEEKKKFNRENGYAAMKELDYLMGLRSANDRFQQYYMGFDIDTQEPPVDLCHLVSAYKSDGNLIPNAFTYCLHVAADYILSYMAHVVPKGNNQNQDGGVSMTGHKANLGRIVDGIRKQSGASLHYHTIGAAARELPYTQIATYLACGFLQKFREAVGRDAASPRITREKVEHWQSQWRLTSDALQERLQQGCDGLRIKRYEGRGGYKDLAEAGTIQIINNLITGIPPAWHYAAGEGEKGWLAVCSGKRHENMTAICGSETDWMKAPTETASVAQKVLHDLMELSKDGRHGPYFAQALLDEGGDSLISKLLGIQNEIRKNVSQASLDLRGDGETVGYEPALVKACSRFQGRKNKNNYNAYENAVRNYFVRRNDLNLYKDMDSMLEELIATLRRLRRDWMDPLVSFLTDLMKTFDENVGVFNDPTAEALHDPFVKFIFQMSDIQGTLDERIKELDMQTQIRRFMDRIWENPEIWKNRQNDGEIVKMIRKVMIDMFNHELHKSLEDYLYDKYDINPNIPGAPGMLQNEIRTNIIDDLINDAIPVFWRDPNFTGNGSSTGSLSVPETMLVVCAAASTVTDRTVRRTGLKNRLSALTFTSGLPMHAYQGTKLMYDAYQNAGTTGLHLYAETGRGEQKDDQFGTGKMNWRDELPPLSPYSWEAAQYEKEAVVAYDRAWALWKMDEKKQNNGYGIIVPDFSRTKGDPALILARNTCDFFKIRKTAGLPDFTFSERSFLYKDGTFDKPKWERALADLKDKQAHLHSPNGEYEEINLRNDGDRTAGKEIVERVRKDNFLRCPRLVEIVKDELSKIDRYSEAAEELESIGERLQEYESDIKGYSRLLFYGLLEMMDGQGLPSQQNIAIMEHTYEENHQRETWTLTAQNRCDEFPYGEIEPLYQGFLKYREKNKEDEPRKALDSKANQKYDEQHTYAHAEKAMELEAIYSTEAMTKLRKKLMTKVSDEERGEIFRFYQQLVHEISEFKRLKFGYQWPKTDSAPVQQHKIDTTESQRMRGESTSGTWTCPSCGEQCNNEDRFCEKCGQERVPAVWICPKCGSKNKKMFCPECGTKKP